MSNAKAHFERTTFETPRASEYFTLEGLSKQTGQGCTYFPEVVIKELADNALDACEAADVRPEISVKVDERGITVSDNGPGLPTETVRKILNFNTRTSDKAAYRSPTRGAQGNALKTVLGMPHALGVSGAPVEIESQGVRHNIRCWLDPAGELRHEHKLHESSRTRGTSVFVPLPDDVLDYLSLDDLKHWVEAFSLLNPHADVKIEESEAWSEHAQNDPILWGETYNAAAEDLTKYRPGDPTSAHWYTTADFERLIHSYIGNARRGGEDLPLGKFVRQFKGLSSTAKAKAVCSHFPQIEHLSDFEDRSDRKQLIALLRQAMREQSKAPKGKSLGLLGAKTIERRFEDLYGQLYDFDYKKLERELVPGLPFTFEFAVTELTENSIQSGHFFHGINFSPTFDDPLEDLWLKGSGYKARGVGAFLKGCYAHPSDPEYDDPSPPYTTVLTHIVTPAPVFLDAGKTRISIPSGEEPLLGMEIGKVMYNALKSYHKAGKKRAKAQTKVDKPKPKEKKTTLKDAVHLVIPRAVAQVSGNHRLPYAARRLFYRVRDLIQQYTGKELSEGYFRDNLLQEYQREHGNLEGLYYEPRGRLHEPHGGQEMDVGTREVEAYEFPKHRFNKLLYVEKRGQFPLLQSARLMERFDMAIMTGQGVATTAARTLLASADKSQKIQIFVLHDADSYGYNIAHTLREETERMPGHTIQVIDLGLTVEQGLELENEPENYVRKEALYQRVYNHLDINSPAWGFFGANNAHGKNVECKRIELDAMSAPQAIELIERGLRAEGVLGKVVPGPQELPGLAKQIYRAEVDKWADEALEKLLDWDTIKKALADEFAEHYKLGNAERYIRARHRLDDSLWWRAGLRDVVNDIHKAKHSDAFKKAVSEKVEKALPAPSEKA